ncbi:uncharacterized protein HHUB_1766 [Halobacterium hubeiense]|uniref:Uncharacterized protein n=1 Tax=Halobacterium hubeiense TaxID=1407499 RepID=A0A0U5ACC7_9EURY|nr:uncharacterized protein HHUB_1766 [Halobacterium hubeiense]
MDLNERTERSEVRVVQIHFPLLLPRNQSRSFISTVFPPLSFRNVPFVHPASFAPSASR